MGRDAPQPIADDLAIDIALQRGPATGAGMHDVWRRPQPDRLVAARGPDHVAGMHGRAGRRVVYQFALQRGPATWAGTHLGVPPS